MGLTILVVLLTSRNYCHTDSCTVQSVFCLRYYEEIRSSSRRLTVGRDRVPVVRATSRREAEMEKRRVFSTHVSGPKRRRPPGAGITDELSRNNSTRQHSAGGKLTRKVQVYRSDRRSIVEDPVANTLPQSTKYLEIDVLYSPVAVEPMFSRGDRSKGQPRNLAAGASEG